MSNANFPVVSGKTVAMVYSGGLLLALLVVWSFADFDPSIILMAYLFPMGLLAGTGFPFLEPMLWLGYLFYIIIVPIAFLYRKKMHSKRFC